MGALLIDAGILFVGLMVVVVAAMASGLPYDSDGTVRPLVVAASELLWVFLIVAYSACCWSFSQGTIGQRALNLRVVRMSDGKPLGIGASLLRAVVWLVCVWTMITGFVAAIVAANNPARRSLVDLAAGSVVVKKV
jgi:uncharacterized RDD family membrane protein YckC